MDFENITGVERASFECISDECDSACCRSNRVILHTDDFERLKSADIDPFEVSVELSLNDYLMNLKVPPLPPLDGLYVLSLKLEPDGRCTFLLADGRCKIYDTRPLWCREFPIKIVRGKIKNVVLCPGTKVGEEKSPKELEAQLDLSELKIYPPYVFGDEKKARLITTFLGMLFKIIR